MFKKEILLVVISLVLGFLISSFYFINFPVEKIVEVPVKSDVFMSGMNGHENHNMPMMNDMLQVYTDKDFLELMILHHQDAVDMANNALNNSQNEFIRKLSESIIKTQSQEIRDMENELENVNN
jgi:uncharacterized protein (DUF305 family)